MAGRYLYKPKNLALAATNGSDTLLFGPESAPFQSVGLWVISKVAVGWVITFADPDGNDIGGTVASGTFDGSFPDLVWEAPGIIPPGLRPKATISNTAGSIANLLVAWVGMTWQVNG